MSEHKPRLVRADRRGVLFEECSHDESVVPVSETANSFKVIIDRGNANVRYSEWLDTEVYRGYVANSGGEIYYCRVAEVRGPGLGQPQDEAQPPVQAPTSITFVNGRGEEVVVQPGDRVRLEVSYGVVFVRKL